MFHLHQELHCLGSFSQTLLTITTHSNKMVRLTEAVRNSYSPRRLLQNQAHPVLLSVIFINTVCMQWCGAWRHCLASRQPWGRIFTASASVSTPDVLALASVSTNLPWSCYCLEAPIPEKPIRATGNSRLESEKFPPLSEKFPKIPVI